MSEIVDGLQEKLTFFRFRDSPALYNRCSTASRCSMCSAVSRENTIISSRYTRHTFQVSPERVMSTKRWKVAGAFRSPNGILKNQNMPSCDVKVVFGISSFATGICQYPALQSNVLKMRASPSESIHSSMRGRGYESLTVMAFRRR